VNRNLPGLAGRQLDPRAGGSVRWLGLPDFPEVRISAGRLDIREFGPADASLVSEVLRAGEWLPLSTALIAPAGESDIRDPADLDWWRADAVHEPRRDGTGLDLMMLKQAAARFPLV
jgi:hypothetical protein